MDVNVKGKTFAAQAVDDPLNPKYGFIFSFNVASAILRAFN